MLDLNFLHTILYERIVLTKNKNKIKIVGLNKNFILDLDKLNTTLCNFLPSDSKHLSQAQWKMGKLMGKVCVSRRCIHSRIVESSMLCGKKMFWGKIVN